VTAVAPRPASHDDDIDHIRDLVRIGVVGSWHYRWPDMQATANRLGLTAENAVYLTNEGRWREYHDHPATVADAIREATTR
jgi:hypothetical protein